jgi:hypothetical protein
MGELFNIFLTSSITLIGGIIIFIIQKLIIILCIKPWQEFNEAKNRLKLFLLYNKGFFINYVKDIKNIEKVNYTIKIQEEFRRHFFNLYVKYDNICNKKYYKKINFCLKKCNELNYINLIDYNGDVKITQPQKVNKLINEIIDLLK